MPKGKAQREALAGTIGTDGARILGAVCAQAVPAQLRVRVGATVSHALDEEDGVRWRVAQCIAARLGGAPEQGARHLLDRLQGACDREV